MRLALFVTCLGDTLFPAVGRAVVVLLERLGHEVEFPEEQTCCGQMHLNAGYADEGRALAERLGRVFAGYDAVVCPSASCAGMVKEELGADGPPVHELSELLVDVLGIDLVELPDAQECCGFGGTFAVKNADVSTAMLSDKMRAVLDTGAEVVCAVDSSCLMHIGGGLSRGRAGVRQVHLAEILASTEDEPWA